jgi:hypothetical protein
MVGTGREILRFDYTAIKAVRNGIHALSGDVKSCSEAMISLWNQNLRFYVANFNCYVVVKAINQEDVMRPRTSTGRTTDHTNDYC